MVIEVKMILKIDLVYCLVSTPVNNANLVTFIAFTFKLMIYFLIFRFKFLITKLAVTKATAILLLFMVFSLL
jgi:hypothetical protein